MRVTFPVFLLLLAGCAPDLGTVELQGVVRDGLQGAGLAGVTATAFSQDFEEVDATLTEDQGWFRLQVPASQVVHVELSGEGLIRSTFTGRSGSNPRLRVPTGASVAITEDTWASLLQTWDGCPGLGEQGTILGTIEIGDIAEENGDPIPVTTAQVAVLTEDGTARAACYLGEDGRYSSSAAESGPSASFLVSNLPPGLHQLVINWDPVSTLSLEDEFLVWVPEDGVAPRFPILVDPPLQAGP